MVTPCVVKSHPAISHRRASHPHPREGIYGTAEYQITERRVWRSYMQTATSHNSYHIYILYETLSV